MAQACPCTSPAQDKIQKHKELEKKIGAGEVASCYLEEKLHLKTVSDMLLFHIWHVASSYLQPYIKSSQPPYKIDTIINPHFTKREAMAEIILPKVTGTENGGAITEPKKGGAGAKYK